MGIDTGAYRSCRLTPNNEVIFDDYFDDIEKENFKYPNGEFIELAATLNELTNGNIDLNKYLICDDIMNCENPVYTSIIKELATFSFEKALIEADKAKAYIAENFERVKEKYSYIFDPLEVLTYLIELWEKGYFVNWSC
jgi:hypothetical protein